MTSLFCLNDLIDQRKSPLNLATQWAFALYSAVRSYLMHEHQVTKIIRFGDRYDFTLRLVPELYFHNKQCLDQDPK
jgi:hypothetical protein